MTAACRSVRLLVRSAAWLALSVVVAGAGVAGELPNATAASGAPGPRASAPDARGAFVGWVGRPGASSHSTNWAGYAATGPVFNAVSGSWIQPAVSCANKVTQSAFWVGIDGFGPTDPTVQQIGTDSDCTKGNRRNPGGPSYYAWFEMFPSSLVVLDTATYPVVAGDAMSAGVTRVGSRYQLTLTDAGHWSFATVQSAPTAPLDASAEWIVEAPTACTGSGCRPVGLADFGSVGFTGATANGRPINAPGTTADQIDMTRNKKGTILKASTSPLGPGGTGFGVTWVSS